MESAVEHWAALGRRRAPRLGRAPRKGWGAGGSRSCAVFTAEQPLPPLTVAALPRCRAGARGLRAKIPAGSTQSEVLGPRAQNGAVLNEGRVKKTRSLEAV